MVNKKSSVIIAAIIGLFCVVTLAYISSCTKPGKGATCDGVVCQNGGYCALDTLFNGVLYLHNPGPLCKCPSAHEVAHCDCPAGYEGAYCETVSASKYLGNWDVKQTVIGSDSAKTKGTDSLYSVYIQSTTPTTFMIGNLCGDQYYNDVICRIDSTNTSVFVIDTLSAFHMVFDHFKMTANGSGYIVTNDSIVATLDIRHLNYNVNWQNDTLHIVMTPHHP